MRCTVVTLSVKIVFGTSLKYMAFTILSLTDFALSPIAGTEYFAKSLSLSGSKKSNQKFKFDGAFIIKVFHPSFDASPLLTQFVEIKYEISVLSGAVNVTTSFASTLSVQTPVLYHSSNNWGGQYN